MSISAGQPEGCTIDDIRNLPEGQRAELIDGELYMTAAPGRLHQWLVKNLTYLIEDYIRHKNGDCEVYPAPFAVFLNADDRIYVEPDLSIICDKEKLTEDGCKGAPDWVIEIASPTSRPMDYNKKLFKYRTAGVREYWIIDLKDKVKAGIYQDLEIDFSQMVL